MNNLEEARMAFDWVARANRAVTKPYLKAKAGLSAVSNGKSFDAVVTQADIGVSKALLEGNIRGVSGFRNLYPASFSEEQDIAARLVALETVQIDPIDGTGDFFSTYQTTRAIPPTTLVSKLWRPNISSPFQPVWGIIFEVIHEFGIISDGREILLLTVGPEGEILEVPYRRVRYEWREDDPVFINRRVCFPQLTLHGPFMSFLRENGLDVQLVPSGGCGITQLQVFRNFMKPDGPGAEAFASLDPLSVSFFAQPDTKTWDLDAAEVIADALELPARTDIFGGPMLENASAPNFEEMHRRRGHLLSASEPLRRRLCDLTAEFTRRNPDCSLLQKDYGYKDMIVAMARGE